MKTYYKNIKRQNSQYELCRDCEKGHSMKYKDCLQCARYKTKRLWVNVMQSYRSIMAYYFITLGGILCSDVLIIVSLTFI